MKMEVFNILIVYSFIIIYLAHLCIKLIVKYYDKQRALSCCY